MLFLVAIENNNYESCVIPVINWYNYIIDIMIYRSSLFLWLELINNMINKKLLFSHFAVGFTIY